MLGGRCYVAIRIDAAGHRQQRLDQKRLIFRRIGKSIGQLEVDGAQTHGSGTGDVSDLHSGGLERENARFRALGVRRQIHQQVEVLGGNPPRGFALRQIADHLEMIAELAITLCPLVVFRC